MDTATAREAAYAEAAKLKPTRYTSDPDVIPRSRQSGSNGYSLINSPAETIKVKAQWTLYFKAMDDALVQYPYTEEELAQRSVKRAPSHH